MSDDLRQRQERERDSAYLGYIAQLPCVACLVHGVHNRVVNVAHLRAASLELGKRPTGGAEKPDDRWTTPLCPEHHVNGNRSQHYYPGGELAFWEDLGIDPFLLCLDLQAVFDHPEHAEAPKTRLIFGRMVIASAAASGRAVLLARSAT